MTYIVYTKSLLIFLEESRQVLPVNRIYVFGNCCNFKALFELTPSWYKVMFVYLRLCMSLHPTGEGTQSNKLTSLRDCLF